MISNFKQLLSNPSRLPSDKGFAGSITKKCSSHDIEVRTRIPSFSTAQLLKFSAALSTSFAIKISNIGEQFALTLIPKGLGGEGCCSKAEQEKSFFCVKRRQSGAGSFL